MASEITYEVLRLVHYSANFRRIQNRQAGPSVFIRCRENSDEIYYDGLLIIERRAVTRFGRVEQSVCFSLDEINSDQQLADAVYIIDSYVHGFTQIGSCSARLVPTSGLVAGTGSRELRIDWGGWGPDYTYIRQPVI